MTKLPRNPKKDKLINGKLILLTYGQIGVIQTCASYISFFFMMAKKGFPFKALIGKESLSSTLNLSAVIFVEINWTKVCRT